MVAARRGCRKENLFAREEKIVPCAERCCPKARSELFFMPGKCSSKVLDRF
jgi:hypothetical protein